MHELHLKNKEETCVPRAEDIMEKKMFKMWFEAR